MKYFTIRVEKLEHPLPHMLHDVAYEVPQEKALYLYGLISNSQELAETRLWTEPVLLVNTGQYGVRMLAKQNAFNAG